MNEEPKPATAANPSPAKEPLSDRLSKWAFVLSIALILAGAASRYGYLVGQGRAWPYTEIEVLRDHYTTYKLAGRWEPGGRFVVPPPGASRETIKVYRPDAVQPGFRAILAWGPEEAHYVVHLFDQAGKEHHRWPIDYAKLGPQKGFIPEDADPHGMKVLPDGSLIVNFDDSGLLARIDACGEPMWTNTGVFHHSLAFDADGSLWTWRDDNASDGQFQHLSNVNVETGKVIRELDLIEDVIARSAEQRAIFGLPETYELVEAGGDDVFHPNDVEPLLPSMADAFPDFAPGDLLISLRNLHLVAVVDPNSGALKWWSHGPWRFQHDPDFMPDGRIQVFNNNAGRGRSTIVSMDPKTRRFDVAFSSGEVRYYTEWAGKQQRLPNGAVLITVPGEGRVLEATWSGELLFEYDNVWTEGSNAYVINAIWLPPDHFEAPPTCSKPAR